jgi:hypothetical protein
MSPPNMPMCRCAHDRNGSVVDRKRLEPAIVVGAKSKLDGFMVTLIAAAKAGELDEALAKAIQFL